MHHEGSGANPAAAHTHNRVDMSGLMYKRRGGYGKHMPNSWQSRYFFLTDTHLCYYDSELVDSGVLLSPDAKPRGSVELSTSRCIFNECAEGEPTEYAIMIFPSEGREKWKLCAESLEDYRRWTDALKARVGFHEEAASEAGSVTDVGTERGRAERGVSPTASAPVTPFAAVKRSSSGDALTSVGVAPRRGGKRLRLKKKLFETAFVVVILNLSLLLAIVSAPIEGALYILLANMVVLRTLNLRASRTAAAESARETSQDDQMTSEGGGEKTLPAPGGGITGSQSLPLPSSAPPQLTSSASASSSPPTAGSTYQCVPPSTAPPPHTWSKCDAAAFNVRVGPEYARFKRKAPSESPIYEPFAVDVFCTRLRKDHIARRMTIPPDLLAANTHGTSVPPVFVVQIQIPSEPPASLFSSAEDGPGWAIVMYFRISAESIQQLEDLSTASPGMRLFAEYCSRAPTTPAWSSRFKVICSCSNMDEMGIPSAISQYNAKPVLIRRTGSLHVGQGYMEKNIHVHKFANMAKQSIHFLSSRCGQMNMQIGFVIEGREDSELPEVLFGCVAINKPQEELAEFLFEEDLI